MLEKIPGLFADHDAQFGDQRGDFAARQGDPRPIVADQGQGSATASAETFEGLHVNDALLTRQQRLQSGAGVSGEIQTLQAGVKPNIKLAEGVHFTPDHPE